MKKLLLSLISLFAIAASAQTVVTFDFDNNYATYFPGVGLSSGSNDTYVADGEFNADQVVTVDGVTFTIKASAADAQTRNRLWASSPRLRMYNEGFSISAPGHKITTIVFKASTSKFQVTAAAGTLEGYNWTGSAETVDFTVEKNTQLNNVTVTLDGDGTLPEPPAGIANTPETAYTVAKAHELIDAGEGLDAAVYVKGTISQIDEISVDYGNATYYISDNGTTEGQLEVYRGYGLNGEKFTSDDDLLIGDVVIVYGKLVNFKGNTHEFTTGSQIYSLNGSTAVHAVNADTTAAVKYNLAGQKVAGNYKGIVIVNGKKVVF